MLGDEPRHGGADDQEDDEARHLHRHHKGDVDIAGCRDDCHGIGAAGARGQIGGQGIEASGHDE